MNLLPATTLSGDNRIHVADLFALCDTLPSGSVDMVLCDLPYGTTACRWDQVIPFEPMWARFKRVIKPRGAIVLTASQPFTSALVMSNPEWFKYTWVWDKVRPVGFQIAKYRPMMQHEDVCVFTKNTVNYYPQMTPREKPIKYRASSKSDSSPLKYHDGEYRVSTEIHPASILRYYQNTSETLHPTQKPVALFEYLIRTYTQAGELVFDPCVGSGTTAVACVNTGRRYVCGDQSAEYVAIARERVRKAQTEARQLELIA